MTDISHLVVEEDDIRQFDYFELKLERLNL